MKKIFFAILLLICVVITTATSAQSPVGNSKDAPAQMSYATNEFGTDQQFRPITGGENEFSIISKPSLKPLNFVSAIEKYYLSQTSTIDTSIFNIMFSNWKTMSNEQKLKLMEQRKLIYAKMADSLHKVNNTGHQLVYMINNTNQEIMLQIQDNSFIGILEAFDDQKWKPIQYWGHSKCGNSYMLKHIPKDESILYVSPIHTGNHAVKLRYKVLGRDRFYYSNIFDGYINISEFNHTMSTKIDKLEVFREWTRGEQ